MILEHLAQKSRQPLGIYNYISSIKNVPLAMLRSSCIKHKMLVSENATEVCIHEMHGMRGGVSFTDYFYDLAASRHPEEIHVTCTVEG